MKQKFLLLLLICLSVCTSAFCQYVSVQSVAGQNPNTVINAILAMECSTIVPAISLIRN